MKDYLEYIEESTNTVKIKTRLSKLLVVLCYLVIWAFNIMASWRFSAGSITEAQAGGTQWIMLPAATIVLSLLIGKNNYWGKYKWLVPIGFGLTLTGGTVEEFKRFLEEKTGKTFRRVK